MTNQYRSVMTQPRIATGLAGVFFVAISTLLAANDRLVRVDLEKSLPDQVTFNAHIRPIMSNTCFACHGPDADDNPSGFRLDSFELATSALPSDAQLVGIKPKYPAESEVYRRIMGESDGETMPPEDFRHQLTDYEKALFKKWIEQGANYEQHWAYAPIRKPTVPDVNALNATALAKEMVARGNAIDAFILQRLSESNLTLSPEADKAKLLRRLSLDLIGLPPTPEELEAYLSDPSSDAYEKQVERLLQSEHFGERMASSWLDLVRFADTVGFHGDQVHRIFPYRDYVISAFNSNKPFDAFTRQQIAGDLLPSPTEEDLIATGMLRLNMVTREGGAQPLEYLAKYRADRVRTLGTAWLGSTLGCCECHNHKYDPFTAKDFYSFGAFFDDIRQWGVYAEYQYTPNKDLRAFNNDSPFPPEMKVKSPSLLAAIALIEKERDEVLFAKTVKQSESSDAYRQWCKDALAVVQEHPDGWVPAPVEKAECSNETQSTILDDGSVLFTGKGDPKEILTISLTMPKVSAMQSLRVEVIPDTNHSNRVGRSDSGRFSLELSAAVKRPNEEAKALEVDSMYADREVPVQYIQGQNPLTITGLWKSGPAPWQLPSNEAELVHTAVVQFAQPISVGSDDRLVITVKSGDVGRLRFSMTPFGHAMPGEPAISKDLCKALDKAVQYGESLDSSENVAHASLVSLYHRSAVAIKDQLPASRDFRTRLLGLRSGWTMTLIAQHVPEEKIPISRVLPRGNWQDESGELAPPEFPAFLNKRDRDSQRRLNRLDLADWLTAPDNPLVARHFVNRTWKQFYGAGLSAKLDDLGNQGEWPSHPLLLDWLAKEFIDSGWNVKHMIRLMVTSATYRQSAASRDDLRDIDPYNRLLAQQSPRRLDAESVRDNALAIAGLLRKDFVGGPSIFPYQPAGYYRNLQFPDRDYIASDDWQQYRRGVYMHWQRTFLHPMLVNFDAQSRDECTADRPLSNSPQQALTLLNDPQFVEAASAFACRLFQESPDNDVTQRLKHGFLVALSREPNPAELESLKAMLEKQRSYYSSNGDEAKTIVNRWPRSEAFFETAAIEPAEAAAWIQVCRVMLNLHETITRL